MNDYRPHALYRFFRAEGGLLYVGITLNLPVRIAAHRAGKPWWGDVAEIRIEHFRSREEALEAERLAIILEQPQFNVVHNETRLVPEDVDPGSILTFEAGRPGHRFIGRVAFISEGIVAFSVLHEIHPTYGVVEAIRNARSWSAMRCPIIRVCSRNADDLLVVEIAEREAAREAAK